MSDDNSGKWITMYRTKDCTRCPQIDLFLKSEGLYDVTEMIYIDAPEGLTESRCRGNFSLSVPTLQFRNGILTPNVLFKNGDLRITWLRLRLLGGEES